MGKFKRQREKQKRRKPSKLVKTIAWVAVLGVLGLGIYGLSQMSNIAYTENNIRVVNFSGLDAKQKRTALEAANRARCACGCGLGLAQCVSTDPSCPVREDNIERIRGMVRDAMAAPSS